jgi:hypothetical protein
MKTNLTGLGWGEVNWIEMVRTGSKCRLLYLWWRTFRFCYKSKFPDYRIMFSCSRKSLYHRDLTLYDLRFSSSNYKEFCLLGYNAVQPGESQLTFWRNISPPSSGSRSSTCCLLHAGFLLDLFLQAEDGSIMSLWNADWLSLDYIMLCLRRHWSQWPCALRHELSSLTRTLGLWVQIPLMAWMFVYLFCICVVLCVGSSLAMGWSLVQGVLLSV